MIRRLAGTSYWILSALELMDVLFGWFLKNDSGYILFLRRTAGEHLTSMAVNREIRNIWQSHLMERGISQAILTQGSLKAGKQVSARTRRNDWLG